MTWLRRVGALLFILLAVLALVSAVAGWVDR